MKLKLVEKDKSSAWYRTTDGAFDIIGSDLNTNTAAGRAAGAGAVWSWRPAKPTREWSDDMHHFASKPACLADLQRAIDAIVPPREPVTLNIDVEEFKKVCEDRGREAVERAKAMRGQLLGMGWTPDQCDGLVRSAEDALLNMTHVEPGFRFQSCGQCGRRNRVPYAKAANCGACKTRIA